MTGLALLALLAALPACAASKVEAAAAGLAAQLLEHPPEQGANVAVLPFEDSGGRPVELGRALADALTRELLRSGKVTVQDRAYLSRMLGEFNLGAVGLTDQSAARRVGRFSAAKYLVVGRLERAGKAVVVEARLIAAETATLVSAARTELKADDTLGALLAQPVSRDPGAGLFDDERLDQDAVFLERPGTDGCRWVSARADVPAGAGYDEGHAAALSLARRKASARLLGRDPGRTPDFSEAAFQGQLEEVLRATRPSLVAAEAVTAEVRKGGRHRLTLEACLKPARSASDNRLELMLNQSRFVAGQEARAIVSVSREARLFLYSADFSGRLTRLWPSGPAPDNRAAPGRPAVFPDEAQRAAGVRLHAELPPGRSSSVELLRVLAVEGEPGTLLDGKADWAGVTAALDGAGLPWAEDVRVFAVYAR